MNSTKKTWLITGCSKGLGRAFAEEILYRGDNVVVTARNISAIHDLVDAYPETALAATLNIKDKEQILEVVNQAEEHFGQIDVLLNNAGYGYRSAVEESDDSDVRALFDTIFFGSLSLIKTVLPGMRKRGSGKIFNVSSIAGRYAAPGSGFYSAVKFGLAGMSDALRKEVGPLGIDVHLIEPGAFRTDFTGRSLKGTTTVIADYEPTVGPRRKGNDHSHGHEPGDPKKAAQVIADLAELNNAPFHILLGSDALEGVRKEIMDQLAELEQWKEYSLRTDY